MKSPIYPVVVISYEMFLRTCERLRAVKFDIIICDEGHRLKNVGAKTTAVSSVQLYMYILYVHAMCFVV